MKALFVAAAAALVVGLTVSAVSAAGVCSTGKYPSCMTCCNTNSTVQNTSLCQQGCTQYPDSPLQKQLRALKANAKQR